MNSKKVMNAKFAIANVKLDMLKIAEKIGLISHKTAMKSALMTLFDVMFDVEQEMGHDAFIEAVERGLNKIESENGT